MYTLPALTYSYDALEPIIDIKTMEIHHTKHHQAYIDKLNGVIERYPELQDKGIETLLRELHTLQLSDADRTAIQNHGGGHANHSLFWTLMDPSNTRDEQLISDIVATFGLVEEMKKQFNTNALNRFGAVPINHNRLPPKRSCLFLIIFDVVSMHRLPPLSESIAV